MTKPLFTVESFAEVASHLAGLPQFDEGSADAARARQDTLTKPPGSLGRLEDIAVFMAGWQRQTIPKASNAQVIVFAGNHGVCASGVNVYPQSVTGQMVANFEEGGTAINQLAGIAGARVDVVALALDRPTADISVADAMDESETLQALSDGYAAVDANADILILGEMGIGNTTIAAALAAVLFGGNAKDWVGPGTGMHAEGIARKAEVVEMALQRVSHLDVCRPQGPFQIVGAVGGREQAALCGAILAARSCRIPVILDGFICTAAAAVLACAGGTISPPVDPLAHCLAGHVGAEPGHRPLLDRLGLSPMLDLGMRLGEGTGAAVALLIVKAALAAHAGMATFAEAGVSGR